MNPITNDSWHWRFLKLMGRHVGYDANTCSYIRALGFAFLLLSFFATIWFTVAFTMTMGLIVSGIFMYEGGISVEVFKLAVKALRG